MCALLQAIHSVNSEELHGKGKQYVALSATCDSQKAGGLGSCGMWCMQVAEVVAQVLLQAQTDVLLEVAGDPNSPPQGLDSAVAQVCSRLLAMYTLKGVLTCASCTKHVAVTLH